ncbi:MAG: hypothetical protein LBQ48_00505 [Oscillospiraceae bacterium]|jgi:hypothetical protein|nr:hypothetical protein [Oscillospiraceae bacterium]
MVKFYRLSAPLLFFLPQNVTTPVMTIVLGVPRWVAAQNGNQHFPDVGREVVCVEQAHFFINQISLGLRDAKFQEDIPLAPARVFAARVGGFRLCYCCIRFPCCKRFFRSRC